MKKITFLIFLFVSSMGFSQNLLTNGDFETGDGSSWGGNSANGTNINVVDDGSGSNFVNQSMITTAGAGWQVGIDQALALTEGESYELSFVASADADRAIIAGIGKAGGDFFANTVTPTITTTPTTYTFTLVANFNTVNDGSRVLFDLGEAVSTVTLDDISLELVATTCNNGVQDGDETGIDCGGATCPDCPTCTDGIMNGNETGVDCGGPDCAACPGLAVPTVAPPTPPNRPTADVVSIFSGGVYSDVTVDQYGPDWGPSSARIFDETAVSDPIKHIDLNAGQVFAGIDFATSSAFDASTFTHFHMDYWINSPIPAGQILDIKLSNHNGGAGETSAVQITVAPSQGGQWVELDILLDDFLAASAPANLSRDAIAQIVITAARGDGNEEVDVFFDNMYFHKNTLGTEEFASSNFKVYPNPTKDNWNIESNTTISSVAVFDILGKQVMALTPNSNDVEINTSSIKTGIYFARIEGVNGSKTVKLIKE